jgi:putative sterol carrier protein
MNPPKNLTIRQMLEGQTLVFNPKAAEDLSATIQFVITDQQDAVYHLDIHDGDCIFHPFPAASPTLTIRTPAAVWLAVSQGRLDGQEALMTGLYTAEGDLSLLLNMNDLFNNEMKYRKSVFPPGPLSIAGMTWMTLAFIPWTLFWVLFNMTDNLWLRAGLPLGLTAILVIYRLIFNKPTWLEWGSLAFFAVNIGLLGFHVPWYLQWGSVLGSTVQGILWLASLLLPGLPLCAEYSQWDYSAKLVRTSLFLHPNAVITLMWGWQYMVSIGLGIAAELSPAQNTILTILRFLLLVPAFIFTGQYPKNADNHPVRDVEHSFTNMRIMAGIGIVIAVGLISLMIWIG